MSWAEEFAPEERLQSVEIQAGLLKELHVGIFGADIAFVVAVDEQHVIGRKLHAGHFKAQKSERELHHVVALHA